MNFISKFFHEFLHPHCQDCFHTREVELEELRDSKICKSCETLRVQLEISNFEKKQLLDKLLHKDDVIQPPQQDYQPIMPKNIPWGVRRQMLEEESKRAAALLKEREKEIKVTVNGKVEAIEKELGIDAGA